MWLGESGWQHCPLILHESATSVLIMEIAFDRCEFHNLSFFFLQQLRNASSLSAFFAKSKNLLLAKLSFTQVFLSSEE